MRADTQALVDEEGSKQLKKKAGLIEEIESRLSPERTVSFVRLTICDNRETGSEIGILLLSDYGVHWKDEDGRSPRIDLAWGAMDQAEVTDEKGFFHLVVTSTSPKHQLAFRLYKERETAALVRQIVATNQPLL